MEECLDSFTVLYDSVQKILTNDSKKDPQLKQRLEEQLASFSEKISELCENTVKQPTRQVTVDEGDKTHLCKSFNSSNVSVLTPSGQQYGVDSMGAAGLSHRKVLRVSTHSSVRDPRISERYAQLKYRTDFSTTVLAPIPKEPPQWKMPAQKKLFKNVSSINSTCYPRDVIIRDRASSPLSTSSISSSASCSLKSKSTPPLKQLEIKLTKLDMSSLAKLLPSEARIVQGNHGRPVDNNKHNSTQITLKTESESDATCGYNETDGEVEFSGAIDSPPPVNTAPDTTTTDVVYTSKEKKEEEDTVQNNESLSSSPSSPLLSMPITILKNNTDINDSDLDSSSQLFQTGNQGEPPVSNEVESLIVVSDSEDFELKISRKIEDLHRSGNRRFSRDSPRKMNVDNVMSVSQDSGNQTGNENIFAESPEIKTDIETCGDHGESEGSGFWSVVNEDVALEQPKMCVTHKTNPLKVSNSKDLLPLQYTCCGCGKTIFRSVDMICYNDRLNVIVCSACFKSFIKGDFVVESGHEIYCSMCGDGGSIVLCDTCEKSICESCIERFLGDEALTKILEEDDTLWSCFSCDSRPILKHQEMCKQHRLIMEQDEMMGRKRSFRTMELACSPPPQSSLHSYRKKKRKTKQEKSKEFVSTSEEDRTDSDCSVMIVDSDHASNFKEKELPSVNIDSFSSDVGTSDELGIGNSDGITVQTAPNKRRMFGTSSSDDINEGKQERIVLGKDKETTGEGNPKDNVVKKKRSNVREFSPLSLLSNIPSSEIDSDDVVLSDVDENRGNISRNAEKMNHDLYSDLKSDSSSSMLVSSSTSSTLSKENGTRKRKRLSLKSKKSWLISRAEYGIEKKAKSKADSNGSAESSDLDDFEIKTTGSKKSSNKRPSNKGKSSSSYLCNNDIYSISDEFESSEDRKKGKTKKKDDSAKEKIQNPSTSRKKRYKPIFSSDEENDYLNNLNSLLTSSESDELQLPPVKLDKSSNKPVEFHLNCVSSDEDDDDLFETPKRKKKVKIISISSGSDNKVSGEDGASSSDDFEESKRFKTPASLKQLSAARKRRMKKLRKQRLSSDDTTTSDETGRENERGESSENTGVKMEKKEDESSDDSETKTTPSKRKNIRKLISDNKLNMSTKEAQKAERERLERLKQRAKNARETVGRIILDKVADEVKVEVRHELIPKILPHQVKGVKFLYNSCCEDLERLNNESGSGAILAHCMGLGKTLQVIAFADALLLHSDNTGVKRVLVLCPVNTLLNWLDEWNKWVPISTRDYRVTVMEQKTNSTRLSALNRWFVMGGVMIIGFALFRNLTLNKTLKRKRDQESAAKYLLDPGADLIVCDEGHVLRQEKSNLSIAVNKVRTMRRIVLTGTPLQNNLLEYYTMVSFVKPNLLGTMKEFRNRFENPIRNGQHSDSLPEDVRKMKQRAHVLHQLLKGCVDRRDYRILAESLPPKYEYVVGIRMTPTQDQLIRRYLERNSGYHTATDLFSTFANLMKVWNHPRVLELDQDRKDDKYEKKQLESFIDDRDRDSLDGFIVFSDQDSSSSSERIKEDGIANENPKLDHASSDKRSPTPNWYQDLLPENCNTLVDMSGKVMFLLDLLKEVEQVGERILVFSQSLLVLDMIEEMLQLPESGRMVEGIHYFRLDGSTKADDRQFLMKKFNRSAQESNKLRLFLISTKAGSLGINLIGANRVVIFDACWNPTHDLQSIFRTYRFGQTKPVFVYRLLAKGTMEEKIYDRQVTKQSLSMRVVDEKQIGRHFSFAQLQELFTYTPPPQPPLDKPATDKSLDRPDEDIIFCNILNKLSPNVIVGYHTHDSLLEHIYDEELTEEEQKLAWENYNKQKEMDSDLYNMTLKMQQKTNEPLTTNQPGTSSQNPTLGTPNMRINTQGPGIAGISPLAGGHGIPINSLSISLEPARINDITIGLDIAQQVKGLFNLRNRLKDTVIVPGQKQAVIQKYITTYDVLQKKIEELRLITPRISELFRNAVLRTRLSPNDLRNLDIVRDHFLHQLKVIDGLSHIPAPHPSQLMRTPISSSSSSYHPPLPPPPHPV